MIKETTHHEPRSTEGCIDPVVTLSSSEGGSAPPQDAESPAGGGPDDDGGQDRRGRATKSNVPSPEPCTREALAKAVKDRFKFDISPLWACMQREKCLPKNLPSDWDPVWGLQGAWEHLQGRRSIRQSTPPKHGAGRFSLGGKALRPACRLCGVARTILLCRSSVLAPMHPPPRVVKLLGRIDSEIGRLRKMKERLAGHVEDYKASQRQYLTTLLEDARERQFEAQSTEQWRELSVMRINFFCENPEKFAELPIYSDLKVESRFDNLEKVLRYVQHDIINPHLPVLQAIWPPRVGRPAKLIAKVRTILKDDGFSWKEVAELVRDDEDIDDPGGARDRARSQVRDAKSRPR